MPIGILVNFSQRSAIVERYFYNNDTNEVCDVNGEVLLFYKQRKWISNADVIEELV